MRTKRKHRDLAIVPLLAPAAPSVEDYLAAIIEASWASDHDVARGQLLTGSELDELEYEQLRHGLPRRSTKGRKFRPAPIRLEDIVKILPACVPLTPGRLGELAAMQRRAMLVVLYRTGVRISELLASNPETSSAPEIMIVIAGQSETAWTVTRAAEGTAAATHTSGATVAHILTAGAPFGGTLSSSDLAE